MINYILNFQFNSALAIWLYWLPLFICAIYNVGAIYYDAQDDIKNRDSTTYYKEKLTVGVIVARIITPAIPLWNLLGAVFHTAPVVFKHLFEIIGNIFDIPLIPRRKK